MKNSERQCLKCADSTRKGRLLIRNISINALVLSIMESGLVASDMGRVSCNGLMELDMKENGI